MATRPPVPAALALGLAALGALWIAGSTALGYAVVLWRDVLAVSADPPESAPPLMWVAVELFLAAVALASLAAAWSAWRGGGVGRWCVVAWLGMLALMVHDFHPAWLGLSLAALSVVAMVPLVVGPTARWFAPIPDA